MASSTDSAYAGFIKRFWRGEVRLVIAFWVFVLDGKVQDIPGFHVVQI